MIRKFGLATIAYLCVTGSLAVQGADVVLDWNATVRNLVQHDGLHAAHKANPGWSTREMAMVNGAIYDIFQAFNRTHEPFMVDTHALPGTSLEAAVHQAAYELLTNGYTLPHNEFPGDIDIVQDDYNARMALIPLGAARDQGIALGSFVAQAYMADRSTDHSGDMVMYTPGTDPGEWRPDPFDPGQSAWGPGWGAVTPFAMQTTADFIDDLPPIPALNSPEYTAAYNMVKEYGELTSTERSAEQEAIGLFWGYDSPSIGPPPVLFLQSLGEVAMQAGNSQEDNARLFAMATVAQADAAIAAWDAKFTYDFWRPVTAIHEGNADGNTDTLGDPPVPGVYEGWRPLGTTGTDPMSITDDFTPPFPAWTSGHATMGGAMFKAIELFYGTNNFDEIDGIIGDDPNYFLTSEEPGSGGMRFYTTFTQVGPLGIDAFGNGTENSPEGENGMSRIYLGIHWIFDQQDGITLGNNIAYYVAGNHFQPIPEPSTLVLALVGVVLVGLRFARRRKSGQ